MAKFLLILLLIFILIRIVTRYAFRSYVKNVQRNFEESKNRYNQRPEGDVKINTKAKQSKKINKDEGDYVDFEEVKE